MKNKTDILIILIDLLLIICLLSGCEKVVDLKYKGNRSQLIIEGNIVNAPGPYFVKITKSIPLSETSPYPGIDHALVTISDDAGHREALTSEGDGVYSTHTLQGVQGRTYTLEVLLDNQTYTAQSTMPELVPFDSIKIGEVTIGGDIDRSLIPVYQDPSTEGNSYRFVLWINNKLVNQHLVLNDDVRNGLVNTLRLEINDDDLKLKPQDQVTINMQCVDPKVGLYYKTLAMIADSGPGGGTTPNNPPNNISNGALGLFSAHTAASRSITIP